MQKKKSVIIAVCLILSLFSSGWTGDIFKIEISPDDLNFKKVNSYDIVELRGCSFTTKVGEPMLPVKSIFVALGAKNIEKIKLIDVKKNELPGTYNILPVQTPQPFLINHQTAGFDPPKQSVYLLSSPYPEIIIKHIHTGSLRWENIGSINIFPLQYNPSEKKLILNTVICFEIEYSTPTFPMLPSRFQKDDAFNTDMRIIKDMIKGLVINPDDVSLPPFIKKNKKQEKPPSRGTRGGSSSILEDNIDYVIITVSEYEAIFKQLTDWRTKKGYMAVVKTVDWIDYYYTGSDMQEKIRNFIKDAYEKWGIEWVLLGGDTNKIPTRLAYGQVSGYPSENIPCDLYYSDLDGNWNADGDTFYGEVDDNVDMYPDVFVGRACVDSQEEAQNFVNKILKYEKDPPRDYQLKMLFLAMKADATTDTAVTKNKIADDYVPVRYYPIKKLYESSGNLNASLAKGEMDKGYCIINHCGHANTNKIGTGPDYLENSDMDALTNDDRLSVFYSIGCWANAIDGDSIAEHFVNNPTNGGVSFVGNSRYGWYHKGQPGCYSEEFDIEFFNSLFKENYDKVGLTLASSKLKFIPHSASDGVYRWIQYTLNLQGDPVMSIWTDTPNILQVEYPGEWGLMNTNPLKIKVSSGDGPVEGAVVCLWKDTDIYTRGVTDSNGRANFQAEASSVGDMNITVSVHNYIPFENVIKVVENTAPQIANIFPEGEIDSDTPLITATILDSGCGVSQDGLEFWLDGESVDGYSFNEENGIFSYKVLSPLKGGEHLILFKAKDRSGNESQAEGKVGGSLVNNCRAKDRSGNESQAEGSFKVIKNLSIIPGSIKIWPNPARDHLYISYDLSVLDAEVNVYIYNLAGEMVKKLGPVSSVESNINWDCLTDSSKKVASGLYVYRIVVSGNGQQVSQIGKFAIIK